MISFKDDRGRVVSVDDSPEMQRKVFDHLMAWFRSHGCYRGESIMQNDAPQTTAAEMLSELADDVLDFDVRWEDEEE